MRVQHADASRAHNNPIMTATPAAKPSNAGKPKRDWPQAVRQYVQRAFAPENNEPSVSRPDMEIKLKQTISDAAETNDLLHVDWDNLPLPQQTILYEREKEKEQRENTRHISTLSIQDTNLSSFAPLSRKRKSTDWEPTAGDTEPAPPWRATTNHRNVFEERISYPDKRQRQDTPGKGSSKFHYSLDNRKNRFEDRQPSLLSSQTFSSTKNSPTPDVDQGPVVGRCQDLEKRYFRLTSAPNPETVRPLAVLEKTLDHLKRKWKKENNYGYICDQFKSLRQDLTVQHIKTEFTVNVYEIHARIALEKGDLGEYNQCQTQLRALYSQNLGGHPTEFKAYRILYFLHTCNRTDMNDVLADLTSAEKRDAAIKHALDARSALALGNYHKFFQLYLDTPNMGAYLMDMFVARERLAALSNICKAWVSSCVTLES